METQIAKFMGPTWGPPGSCRPQMGPMLAPWTLLLGDSTADLLSLRLLINYNTAHETCTKFSFCCAVLLFGTGRPYQNISRLLNKHRAGTGAIISNLHEISLRWMQKDHTDYQSTLVPVMAWFRQATRHYLNQHWPSSVTSYGVTRIDSWRNIISYECNYRLFNRFSFYCKYSYVTGVCDLMFSIPRYSRLP